METVHAFKYVVMTPEGHVVKTSKGVYENEPYCKKKGWEYIKANNRRLRVYLGQQQLDALIVDVKPVEIKVNY
jgi:hypothetical protein